MATLTFSPEEWKYLRDGLRQLEQDHRDARGDADDRARDTSYPYRPQAAEASVFHNRQIDAIGALMIKVWHWSQV